VHLRGSRVSLAVLYFGGRSLTGARADGAISHPRRRVARLLRGRTSSRWLRGNVGAAGVRRRLGDIRRRWSNVVRRTTTTVAAISCSRQTADAGWLKFNVPFQHKYGYIRDERSGMESYPLTQWRKAGDMLTSTLTVFLFGSHPKMERDREAHLNRYASAYNWGRQLLHCKTKLNQVQQNTRINLNYLTDR